MKQIEECSFIISEEELQETLTQCGLRLPPAREIALLTEAESFITRTGYPCVLKIQSRSYRHKSELEGVITDIKTFGQLEQAFMSLWKRFPKESAFLLQKQIDYGLELYIALTYDRTFGHLLSVSLEEMPSDSYGDAVFRRCPLTPLDAESMVKELHRGVLLGSNRHTPRVRTDMIKNILIELSQLPRLLPNLNTLELHPVICNQEGEFAVDFLFGEHVMAPQPLTKPLTDVTPFFQTHNIAVVGASLNPGKGGSIIIENLIQLGYKGEIFPIIPNCKKLYGLKCFASISAVPVPIELLVLAVPRVRVLALVREAARVGVQNFIVCSTGFSDSGGTGARLEHDLIIFAREHKLRIMGPNSLGTINTRNNLVTSLTRLESMKPGSVALLGQSGVFSSGYARMFAETLRPRISKIACLGNEALLDESDFLYYLRDDEQTSAIGLYIEGIRYGSTFSETIASTAARKPVVVVKSGNSKEGADAVAEHTGSLAVDQKVFAGIARQCGFVQTDSLQNMLDTLKIFELQPLPLGKNVAVISVSGLGCVLAADYCMRNGLNLASLSKKTKHQLKHIIPDWAIIRNPINLWPTIEKFGPEKAFATATAACAQDPEINIIVLVFVLLQETQFRYDEVFKDLISAHPGKLFA
ncbi:acetate--CoA ligase family protein, partial [bacterium]|nr:acetate--CoA ligase family protein [bacterium]